jgi:hypothetical protein
MSGRSNISAPSTRIVQLVAANEEVSPLALSPPLASFVDPDALDSLFDRGTGAVTFDAWGYRITVTGDGNVVTEPNDRECVFSPDECR